MDESQKRDSKIDFRVSRFQAQDESLNEIVWKIRVLNPDKRIDRCSVLFNDHPLRLWDDFDEHMRTIEVGGGANFVIPNSIFEPNGKVVVKSDTATLKSYDFDSLEITKP